MLALDDVFIVRKLRRDGSGGLGSVEIGDVSLIPAFTGDIMPRNIILERE